MKKLSASAARKRLSLYEEQVFNPLRVELRARKSTAATDFPESPYLVEESLQSLYTIHDYLRRVAVELEEER